MKRILLSCALSLAVLPATLPVSAQQSASPRHTFAIEGNHFTLDGRPFKILSGELHYARIPREYWHQRLRMAKAMGLNTIATYVFWNVHEPAPGHYDFSGNNDLVAFIQAAQEEGLWVILRASPYACAEWEFGGFPAWLLKDPRMHEALRSDDPAFMVPAERWINRLAKEVAPLQIGRGGPILITQVENEYGSFRVPFNSDHTYMTHMRDIYLRAGFTDSLLDTVDGGIQLPYGGVPGVFTGVNFGVGDSKKELDLLAAFQPNKPLMVTEYWPGWFDHWGHPHETRSLRTQLDDLDYILSHGDGVNLYMFHGGTSFGFMSGANFEKGSYLPEVTSYDYGAPLDESGRPTEKFFAFRKIFAKYACTNPVPTPVPDQQANTSQQADTNQQEDTSQQADTNQQENTSSRPKAAHFAAVAESPLYLSSSSEDATSHLLRTATEARVPHPSQSEGWDESLQTGESCLPAVPTVAPPITIPQITFTESTSLWDNLPTPIHSEDPKPMEQYDQAYGYILYRTTISGPVGNMGIGRPRDYVQLYLDGRRMTTFDRRNGPISYMFEVNSGVPSPGETHQLELLVANDSRVNFSAAMRDENKGLVQPIIGRNGPIKNWQVYPLPMTTRPAKFHPSTTTSPDKQLPPTFFRAHFALTQTGDTFLDTRNLTKGALWINGHPIGRFWNVGPQQTLYVPGPWLRKGENEIIVFDLQPASSTPTVAGLEHPILDGPTPEQPQMKQEQQP